MKLFPHFHDPLPLDTSLPPHDTPWTTTLGPQSRLTDKNIDDFLHAWSYVADDICYLAYDSPCLSRKLKKHSSPRILILHSFFTTRLTGGNYTSDTNYNFQGVRKDTDMISMERLEHVLVAINHPKGIGHWTLAHIRPATRHILHYNSAPNGDNIIPLTHMFARWWYDLAHTKQMPDRAIPRSEWTGLTRRSPRQVHNYDCGIHLLSNIACLTSPTTDLSYLSTETPTIRHWMHSLILFSRSQHKPPTQLALPPATRTHITPQQPFPTTTATPPSPPQCLQTSSHPPATLPAPPPPLNPTSQPLPKPTPSFTTLRDQHAFWTFLSNLTPLAPSALDTPALLAAIKFSDHRLRLLLSSFSNWNLDSHSFHGPPAFHRPPIFFQRSIPLILDEIEANPDYEPPPPILEPRL